MNRGRRYLTFSLRTLFILWTAAGIALGVTLNRAREQREAVRALEALGATVPYDWQTDQRISQSSAGQIRYEFCSKTGGPPWLHELFEKVEDVYLFNPLDREELRKMIPHLKRLRRLERLNIVFYVSNETLGELGAALPDCAISLTY